MTSYRFKPRKKTRYPTVKPIGSFTEKKECCVCFQLYSTNGYKILEPCLHSLCTKCFINVSTCPVCREILCKDMPKNNTLKERWNAYIRSVG